MSESLQVDVRGKHLPSGCRHAWIELIGLGMTTCCHHHCTDHLMTLCLSVCWLHRMFAVPTYSGRIFFSFERRMKIKHSSCFRSFQDHLVVSSNMWNNISPVGKYSLEAKEEIHWYDLNTRRYGWFHSTFPFLAINDWNRANKNVSAPSPSIGTEYRRPSDRRNWWTHECFTGF